MHQQALRIATLSFGIVLLFSGVSRAQSCSTAMLNGTYGGSFRGERLGLLSGSPPVLSPFPTANLIEGVEVFQFDGQGNMTNLNLAMRDGVPNALGQSGLTADGF